jgi:N-acetylmuramoyl-L-alanine amidase
MRRHHRSSARFLSLVVATSLGSARLAKADPDNTDTPSNGRPPTILNMPFGDDAPQAPPPPVVQHPHPRLGKGCAPSATVKRIQQILNKDRAARGLDTIDDDSCFGPATQEALRQFQKSHGLEQTCVTDSETWDELEATDATAAASPNAPEVGAARTVENLLVSTPTTGTTQAPMHLSARSLDQLARIIEAEAGVCSLEGKIAVAAVVLNRVREGWAGGTVLGVISQEAQFSGYGDDAYRSGPSADSREAARRAAAGEDPSNGATYYYNPYLVKPAWAKHMTETARIGTTSENTHRFMRP